MSWILREIPRPCISAATSDFRMSRSRVPCKRVVGSEPKRGLLLNFYRKDSYSHIECQQESRCWLEGRSRNARGFAHRTAKHSKAQGGNATTNSWSASSSADPMQ